MKTLKKPECFLKYEPQNLNCIKQATDLCRKCNTLTTYEYYFKCPDCDRVFFTKEDYEDHRENEIYSQLEV